MLQTYTGSESRPKKFCSRCKNRFHADLKPEADVKGLGNEDQVHLFFGEEGIKRYRFLQEHPFYTLKEAQNDIGYKGWPPIQDKPTEQKPLPTVIDLKDVIDQEKYGQTDINVNQIIRTKVIPVLLRDALIEISNYKFLQTSISSADTSCQNAFNSVVTLQSNEPAIQNTIKIIKQALQGAMGTLQNASGFTNQCISNRQALVTRYEELSSKLP